MKHIETKCVQDGYNPKDGDTRVLPLYQSTTYVYDTPETLADLFNLSREGHIYSRISNPTVAAFEEKVASLEGGIAAVATSSGLAAEALTIMNVCSNGDNFLSSTSIYGGTFNLFNIQLRKQGIDCRFFDQDLSIKEIEKKIDKNTKLIFLETLANPAVKIPDFERFSKLAKKYGILLVVDNTLATPYICRPIEHGANIVIHSTTKYLDGHAQAVGGILVDAGNFNYKGNERFKEFNVPDRSYHGLVYADQGRAAFALKARVQLVRDYGMVMAPFSAYITNLGTETLHLRMKQHSANALALAKVLEKHEKIEWVRYPALKGNAGYKNYKKYFIDGLGSGMVVIGIKGTREEINSFMKNLKLFRIVTHVADARSCVLHPATTTHRQLSDEELIQAGISSNLVRLSVGIENQEDIINDILQALDSIK